MQNFSNKKIKNDLKDFKKISPSDLPALPRCYYYVLILYFIDHYRKMIADIFSRAKDKLKLPMSIKHLEKYLTGYKFTYIGFPENGSGINGFFDIKGDSICIFYNQDLNKAQIKFTKVHELFHFYQSIDPQVRRIFDDLMKYCGSDEDTENMIRSLNEEVADLATYIYLMPPEYFDKKSQETKHTLKDLIEYATSRLRDSIKSL